MYLVSSIRCECGEHNMAEFEYFPEKYDRNDLNLEYVEVLEELDCQCGKSFTQEELRSAAWRRIQEENYGL